MKVVCFANNAVGLKTVQHLRESRTEVVALVTHDPRESKLADEIIEAAEVKRENLIVSSELDTDATFKQTAALKTDCEIHFLELKIEKE